MSIFRTFSTSLAFSVQNFSAICACFPRYADVIRHVDPDLPDEALSSLWGAHGHDTTGAMAGKVSAFLHLARKGAECFIMRGDAELGSLDYLLENPETWPAGLLYTRIGY